MTELLFVLLGVMPVLVILAGVHDLATMKIPNWISGLLVLGFFPAALAAGLPLSAVLTCVAVGVGALLGGMGMFALNWLGGGDAKLLAAVSLWLGLSGVTPFILFTAVAGGGLCLFLLSARPHLHVLAGNGPAWIARLMQPKGDVPYGVAIAVGALIAYPASPLVTAFIGG
ncbi:A24 family peptidase [Brevundimonas faecalis]|uniref:Prepilin peptidase CpaA n=1 Tax=Brevundimonas faecalis TaxID=947378 RepID=A0ABV2RBJ7_9CAUL